MDIRKGINPLDSSKEKAIKSKGVDDTIQKKERIIKEQKKRILIPFIVLLVLSLLSISGIVIYFYVWKKRKNKSDNSENKEKKENNAIIAKYKIYSGKEIQLINENILDEDNYKIELIGENKRLRNLKQIRAKNTFDYTGEITISINFFIKVKSLEKLFEDISQLKQINFTNFDMSEVTSMDSIFSGCS